MATIALELVATARGFIHRLRVPVERAEYIISQLRTHVPGIHASITRERLDEQWTLAYEFGMTNANFPLRVTSPEAVTAQILASAQALSDGETIVMQALVIPMPPQTIPSTDRPVQSTKFSVRGVVLGDLSAGTVEIEARRKKLTEPNVRAVLRIAVKAGHEKRAKHLIKQMEMALATMHTADSRFKHRRAIFGDVGSDIEDARAPRHFPMQLSARELVSLSAWPLGQPHVAGLPAGRTRHLPATEAVPRTGRIIGRSTMPGNERPIAISARESLKHMQIVGGTGSGKTELAGNLIGQNVAAGDGVVMIDPQGKLYNLVLDVISPERKSDVIALDLADTGRPVGFNILQGNPQIVAANVQRLFENLYPQDARGVRVRQALYHAIMTLMLSKNATEPMTFADITPLCIPRANQVEFSDNLIRGVSHIEELAEFWQEIENLSREQRATYFGPLMARVWQLNNRRELRNIFGQSASGFNLREAIRQKKIVLLNLGGLGDDVEGLVGSIFLNALWSEVKAGAADPNNPTYLYIDEFHRFMNLPVSPGDMFAQARGLGLAATIMYQHADQLGRELQAAVANNVRSPLVFQALGDEARFFTRLFGRQVSESDFENLRQYEAIMRMATADGVSGPMTLSTLPLRNRHGLANETVQLSRERYGRPVAEVEAEIAARRNVGGGDQTDGRRPPRGRRRWS
ncbi:type IV secretory system conjugative DNA transfer family protein [Streptomyces phaeochromogenes]|uniref:type IV secretory system conjugative DNA transfer family protein n=1 Tax=Streptomyces phaeochromogenes TaxID=1923 RepID=UPI0036A05990